jgi:hypothetical protein
VEKGVRHITNRSQTFSLDILVAAGIFIVGIIIFFVLITSQSKSGTQEKIIQESELLPKIMMADNSVSASNITFVIDKKVDTIRLNRTMSMDYGQLKNQMGITSDFCLYFEDKDTGGVMDLDEDPCRVRYSIGDPRLNLTLRDEISGSETTLPCGFVNTIHGQVNCP